MSETGASILKREIRPMFGTERRVWVSALAFGVALYVFELAWFPAFLKKLTLFLTQDLDAVGLVLFPLYFAFAFYLFILFVQAAIASRWPFRIAYILVFGFATMVEYSYQNALDRFTNYYDVFGALSATGEQQTDAVGAFVSYISLVPTIALAILAISTKPREKLFGWKMLIGLMIFSSLFLLHVSTIKNSFFEREFPNNSVITFAATLSDLAIHSPIQQTGSNKRPPVTAPPAAGNPTNNIILIFDESIRSDHLSLNGYDRQTTPFLDDLARKHLLTNWGTAASAATSSHPSYDAFVIGAQPDELENIGQSALNVSRPSIFQYAKAMGYRTILFDGQMMEFWGGIKDDLNFIDEFDSLAVIDRPDRMEDYQTLQTVTTDESERKVGMKQWQIDSHIAELVHEIFTSSTGNFIFVYKRGCHFPYEKNFPPEAAIWQPTYRFHNQYEIPPADQINAVVNSYDNSLRYNLDGFFTKLANDYANLPNNTVIVYTGDHGESFFENGRAGHGGDTVGEAEVPLFMLGLSDRNVDTAFKASHHNLFATLLDLMNYPEELRNVNYSISLFKARSADSRPRFFNPGPGKKVPFDR
jgi:glucan phosphoethanolaminetransferase (alkaline phosphatase superfamily)